MNKKELQKISLQYRTLASQMLKIDSQEEIYCIQQFFDFITHTDLTMTYINSCKTVEYDFKRIFAEKEWRSILELPVDQKEMVSYGYQLLQYILDGPKELISLCLGYTGSNKFSDNIEAFVRKSIEPFVVALRTYIELTFIDSAEPEKETNNRTDKTTIFLSYCQKDSDIADCLEDNLIPQLHGEARISRDVRDVEFHESFRRFMESIEKHDFVITIISDNYLKSRNCMYEMLEVVKDSDFSKKLLYIVLSDNDAVYYKEPIADSISADIYSPLGQAKYSKYWSDVDKNLVNQINEIGDPMYAINQVKERRIVQKILIDLPAFLDFLRDNKGLAFEEQLRSNFSQMIAYMKI